MIGNSHGWGGNTLTVLFWLKSFLCQGDTLQRKSREKAWKKTIVQYYNWSKLIKAQDTSKKAYPTAGLPSLIRVFAWSLMLAATWLHCELDQGADPAQK